jgi:D-tagatose-1,6-bisphosphate aldolase subunit GatZ/KbaZ
MNEICPFKEIIGCQKKGIHRGIYSICSANEYVIESAMEKSLADNTHVLIESTANQVNQFGGYTGMKPEDFKLFVFSIGKKVGFPFNKIILGGDHLGPYPWREEKVDQAMEKACEMVMQYVRAGFTKIHIDTSIPLADDPVGKQIDARLVVERGATLCLTAEETFKEIGKPGLGNRSLVYVIGTEVPSPGGSQEISSELKVTEGIDFEKMVECYKEVFYKYGLKEAWENVIGVVVQPGVDFEKYKVFEYNSENTKDLCSSLKKFPNLVFEGHSTDYQKKLH